MHLQYLLFETTSSFISISAFDSTLHFPWRKRMMYYFLVHTEKLEIILLNSLTLCMNCLNPR